MTTSVGQTILGLIENDLAAVGGTPLITLLQTLQAAKGNVLLQQAAIMTFVASAPQLGLTLGMDVEGQLLGLAITKLQGLIAAAPAAAVSAAPPAAI